MERAEPTGLPVPAAEARAADLLPAGLDLNDRVRAALAKELCPGERVELVLIAGRASEARRERRLALWTAGILATGVYFVEATAAAPSPLSAFLFGGASLGWLQAAAARLRGRNLVYVATNQRCFQMAFLGPALRFRDVTELPRDGLLEPEELAQFHQRLAAVAAAAAAAPADEPAEKPAKRRELPRHLREALEQQLAPGEELLWAYQPTVRDHASHVPLDPATAGLISLTGLTTAAAVIGMVSQIAVPESYAWPMPVWGSFAAAAAGLWSTSGALVWRRMRATVYALTDRRGLTLGPGGAVKEFNLADMRRFQRTQDGEGLGNLATSTRAAGFFGVKDVKYVDDLLKQRATRDRRSEVVPALGPEGRGDEPAAPAEAPLALAPDALAP